MPSTTFPNSSNSGVPAGTTLTVYRGPTTITRDGTVIENAIINGTLSIKAANVTIKNSVIQNFGWWGIEGEDATNLRVENSDFIGLGRSEATNSAILGSGTFVGNDIQGVAIGIQLTDGASTVRGNYIHDLASQGADPHYDGITALGRQSNVLIEHNMISVPKKQGTASILIQNFFGPVNNVVVRDNFMIGDPSYTLYVDGSRSGGPITNVTVEDNYVERGYYGYFSVTNSNPIIRNNVQWQDGVDPTPYPIGQGPTPNPTPAPNPTPTPTPNPTPSPDGRTFTGTSGKDSLASNGLASARNEKFYGLAGDDILTGGAGADHLDGGAGADTASYAGSNVWVNVRLDTGNGSNGHATGDKLVGIENLTGSSHNDVLRGNSGANVLDGGAGADYMAGGAGNDTYVVDTAKDVVAERSGTGSGRDVVRSSVSYTIASNVEELHLTGTANLNGTGNTGSNVLRGNSGNNVLNGHNGNDVINGGRGNDTLTGGYQKDTFVFDTALNASNNVDRITDFSVVDDVIHLDNAVFTALTNTGTLAASAFAQNTTGGAKDSNDRIIYETDTGELYYDANGSASGGSVHFATLKAGLNLTAADFVVI
jgi:Ca2+-binding RTX toxin-like protein